MPSMVNKDYYAILGVSQNADTETIRKAFQQKARTLHPDVNKEPDAEERFKEVSEAYAVLSDAEKRARYDALRANPFAAANTHTNSQSTTYAGGSAGSGWPFGGSWTGTWTYPGSTRGHSYRPQAASDVQFEVPLSSKDARAGVKLPLTYTRYKRCNACKGTGSEAQHEPETCPTCKGAGSIDIDLMVMLGFGAMRVVCPECEGSGKIVSNPCASCGGAGRVAVSEELELEVPARSHDGDTLRVKGKGNEASLSSERGDFVGYISVSAERLSQMQKVGFRVLGFCVSLLVLGITTQTLGSMLFLFSGPLLFSLFMLFGSGSLRHHELGWWRNAALIMWEGIKSGLVLAVVIMLMRSFTFGLSHAFLPAGS